MARMPGLNANFDNISSATISRYIGRKYTNHVPSHHPFLFKIFARGNAVEGHGYQYVEQVRYPSPVGPKPIGVADGYTPIPPPVEPGGFSALTYIPAFFAMNIAIDKYDEAAQGPGTTIVKYLETKMAYAMDTFMEFYQQSLWATPATVGATGNSKLAMCSIRALVNGGGTSTTGGANPAPKPAQLIAAVEANAPTLVAGIERNQAGAAYECSNIFNPTNPATPSVQLLATLYNACVLNSLAPDLCIMPEALYGYYDAVVAAQQRYTGASELAKVGFESFKFKQADVVFDDNCPSDANQGTTNQNQMFMLSTEHFYFRYDTLKPKFERADYPGLTLKNYMGTHMVQITSDHLGRRQARHAKVALPQ